MNENKNLEGYEEQFGTDFWSPKEIGTSIEGKIIHIEEGIFGKVYELQNKEEKIRTPSHKVLQNKINKAKIGDYCKIVFTGEGLPKARGENGAKLYDVGLIKQKEETIIPNEDLI
jgi:hypothetical protein